MLAIARPLNPLAPFATIAIAAAEGQEAAASVDTRGVGELFQAVGTLSKRLAVRAVREATAVDFDISLVFHAPRVLCHFCRFIITGVPNLLVVLVVLGHHAGGQGSDEDGEVLHFEFKRNFMSAQQSLQAKNRNIIMDERMGGDLQQTSAANLGKTLALYTTNTEHSTLM